MSARLARTQHLPHDSSTPFHHRSLGFAAIGRPDVLLPEGEHGDGGAPPAAPAAPAAPAPAAPAPAPAPSSTPTEWDGKVESLPEPVQKMIRELRQENGNRRTATQTAEQRQQELIKAVAKAAGIELPGDEQPDPAKLTEQLTATQAQAKQAAVELAVYKAAGTHKGDPNALLDSRAFLAKVADLDPAADDFAAQIDAAVKQAVTDNPKLKTVQVAGASGAEFPGGSGDGAPRTPKSLDQAVAGHYGT